MELPKDSVVVDVGGGIGSVSVMVAEAFPHLRFVVEDRAPVVAIAPQVWGISPQHGRCLRALLTVLGQQACRTLL